MELQYNPKMASSNLKQYYQQRLAQLSSGLTALGLHLPTHAKTKLIDYLQLLAKWNQTYNLTAINDPTLMVSHHLLDSLAIQGFLTQGNSIDVGTGAGLPGIPLAIASPQHRFHLLDSNGKKIRFLQQVCHELQLDNVTLIHQRVENYHPAVKFHNIISRAFASLVDMVKLTKHLSSPTGRFLAMKGVIPTEELEAFGNCFTIVSIHRLRVPGLDAERHLIIAEERRSG